MNKESGVNAQTKEVNLKRRKEREPAAQTGLMVRRVVVRSGVVAGGVDARRNPRRTHFTTLQLRHCTTLAPGK